MKFAGPSMGAALGSGFAGGIASAQDMMRKEELQRDTSAMSTYSKLVSSGEWEPVGKEGVKDGGVLRVGNVGFLSKVERPPGVDWKAQKAMSLMQYRRDQTRQADERLDRQRDDKGAFTVYTDRAGNKKRVYEGEELPGPGWTREVGVNLVTAQQANTRLDTGLDKTYYLKVIDRANKVLGELPPSFIINKMRGDPSKEGMVKSYDESMRTVIWATGQIKKLGGGRLEGPLEEGSKLDKGLREYEISGAPTENIEAVQKMLGDPKAKGMFDRIVSGLKDFNAVEFLNKLAAKIMSEEKKKPTPFEVDTTVAP